MRNDDLLILKGDEVTSLLRDREHDIIAAVRGAYESHAKGTSASPFATPLHFPGDAVNRIVALPAYLGESPEVAGLKWIASFPDNGARGIDRASAVVILNSTLTGRPEAILEGSIISAKRTAASAALAARVLHGSDNIDSIGLIGCGLINFEIARFLFAVWPKIDSVYVHDTYREAAIRFKDKVRLLQERVEVCVEEDVRAVFRKCPIVSLATTALRPHIVDISGVKPGSTILHVSLRDFEPGVILSCDNVVDDIDHVCRAQTSIHLTEQLLGGRDFIRTTLGNVLLGEAPAREDPNDTVIFSPFGLGILDLAVGILAAASAAEQGKGTRLESFFPNHWVART